MDSKLTLEKAVIRARQGKAIKQQQQSLRNDSSIHFKATNSVDAMNKSNPRYRQQPPQRAPQIINHSMCTRCGKSPSHSKDRCPARDATCKKCNKNGHFKVVYRSKTVKKAVDKIEEGDTFLGAITDTDASLEGITHTHSTDTREPQTVTLSLNNRQVLFKTDTGADVTVIPEAIYDKSKGGPLLQPNGILKGPSKQKLNVIGYIKATLGRN